MSVKKAMLGFIFSGLLIANWQDNMYIFIVFVENYLVLSYWHFHNCFIYFRSKVRDLSSRQLTSKLSKLSWKRIQVFFKTER